MIILFALQCILTVAFIFLSLKFFQDLFQSGAGLDEMALAAYLFVAGAVLAASAVVTWQAM